MKAIVFVRTILSGKRRVLAHIVMLLFCISSNGYGQHLFMKMAGLRKAPSAIRVTPISTKALTVTPLLTPASGPPTIVSFFPVAAGAGAEVKIIGSNFDANTSVSFNGTPAAALMVLSSTEILATVGMGSTGSVAVTNMHATTSRAGFSFAQIPSISDVDHSSAGGLTTVIITGSNFLAPATVRINSGASYTGTVTSGNTMQVTIPGNPILFSISVSTPGGAIDYNSSQPPQGSADLNLPDFGNGLTLIPTPSLDYSQVYQGRKWGFRERIWGNSLGIDSSLQKLGAKFLSPQISVFGLSGEIDKRLTGPNSSFSIGFAAEFNFLIKKVSYFDTAGKSSSNFNPFLIHPRFGFVSTLLHDNAYIGIYANVPVVVGENEKFADFFGSHSKNIFVYPEIDLGGMINLGSSGSQAIKIDLNMVINNGEAQFMTGSADKVIPFLKIGFVTAL